MKRILIAGNPNAGKTTLFNRLAGTKARTGNYPGVTVDRKSAKVALEGQEVELVDVPGTYSLSARSPEEQIAVDALLQDEVGAVLVVVDATTLVRGLYLAQQVLETGRPTLVALNMMDEAREAGLKIDSEHLGRALGAPVVELVAATGEGVEQMRKSLHALLQIDAPEPSSLRFDDVTEEAIDALLTVAEDAYDRGEALARARALWGLLSLGEDELEDVPEAFRRAVEQVRKDHPEHDFEERIVGQRYAHLEAAVAVAVQQPAVRKRTRSDRIDAVLTHPVWGMLAFAAVMYVVFEALFSWSDPAIGVVEDGVGWLQTLTRGAMPPGPLTDLLVEGIIAGVGNVVVFVPQIGLLFFLIAFLEDSGYLARVAFVIDRLMKGVGLHGKAFVPLLSGFACAIPSVMATRTIANRKDRLVTMLALPLMSCSARLPVYVLVIGTVFANEERVGGWLSVGALALFAMYALSVLATLGAAAVIRRTVLPGPRPALLLELPPYRAPVFRNLLSVTWDRVRSFLVDAGTVILALTIVLWALLTYPKDQEVIAETDAAIATAEAELSGDALEARVSELEHRQAGLLLEHSAAGRVGKAIEPALEPLGMDWRMGIGVLGAFAAREVFVSTLGVVFGIGDEVDEESASLREQLRRAERADGTPLMTPLSGIALMIFFVLACQCMSTIAVVRRESGSWRWPIFMVAYMTALAYGATLVVYQVGSAMGWGLG